MRSTAADPTPSLDPPRRTPYAAYALAVGWLAYLGVLQWSVVRFRVPIVLTLTGCAIGLGLWLARRTRVDSAPRWLVPVVLVSSLGVTWAVPLFSYLRGSALTASLATLGIVGVGAAGLLSRPTAVRARAAYGLAVVGHVVTATITGLGSVTATFSEE